MLHPARAEGLGIYIYIYISVCVCVCVCVCKQILLNSFVNLFSCKNC